MKNNAASGLAERFRIAPGTLFWDRFMDRFIRTGGLLVILVVFLILVFILLQVLPLLGKAKVKEKITFQTPTVAPLLLGADEWGLSPFLVDDHGHFRFYSVNEKGAESVETAPDWPREAAVTAAAYRQESQAVLLASEDGRVTWTELKFDNQNRDGAAVISHEIAKKGSGRIAPVGGRIMALAFGDGGSSKVIAALVKGKGKNEVHWARVTQESGMESTGELVWTSPKKLDLPGNPVRVLVKKQGDGLVVLDDAGLVSYFEIHDEDPVFAQSFRPFEDQKNQAVATLDFLFGDVTLIATSASGLNRGFGLYAQGENNQRLFGRTKEFDALPGEARAYAPSARNKSFFLAGDRYVTLRYGTTEATRWEKTLAYHPVLARLSGKNDAVFLYDEERKLHVFSLQDPHPEASFKAFFGKIWYEGKPAPEWEWQSTGGSDDFEPKLSLIPLILGTLKGTFYALLIAFPVALLAAIYVSQFLRPEWKAVVKPVMEIMASLPSVVLGFLAAIYVAPLLETKVPSILAVMIALPLAALLLGTAWSGLPMSVRKHIPPGLEFLYFIPVFLLVMVLAWNAGGAVERLLFTVHDPATGQRIADFRLWWPEVTGLKFDQRNSLVVGFMMGFAVMPILFTIAEDSLSNVPDALRSGSLALGATRWQTAWNVVLPSAAAGIFSAIMIAFGRAVGETMIVVMATGNTPILDFNIFNGMRTLSANIAVELPEAPQGGTLYRTIFFGALLLFLFTFLLNTLAEILRQRLREKYKSV